MMGKRLKGAFVTLAIPGHCLSTLAQFWCSQNPHFILNDDVREWLEANDIVYEIGYTEDPTLEESECDHFMFFVDEDDAFAFKMRWY